MALSRNAQIALFISSSSLSGAARTLRSADKNNTGTDDVAGLICDVAGEVLLSLALDDIADLKSALQKNIEVSQKLLDDLGE